MKSHCSRCASMCCRYVALPFETPTDQEGFDEVRWFLMHEAVTVFVTDGAWYISFASSCRHLREDGLCGTYETRPQICREYADNNCDFHGGDYEYQMLFTHPSQVERYAQRVLQRAKSRPKRKASSRHKSTTRRTSTGGKKVRK